ncbi:MAG: hypothetical protein C0594_05255, partial [Marinilabiliales bacterium]
MKIVIKFFILNIFFLFSINLQAQKSKRILLYEVPQTQTKLIQNSQTGFTAISSMTDFNVIEQTTNNTEFTNIFTKNHYKTYTNIGEPQLPACTKLIEVPQGADVEINIIDFTIEEISLKEYGFLNPIIPIQPSVKKSDDPENLPFYFNSNTYENDDFYSPELVRYIESGTLRGVQMGKIQITPFEYNPVRNILRVYKEITFEVIFSGGNHSRSEQLKRKFYSPLFESSYHALMNYSEPENKYAISSYPIGYIIISDPMFETMLQPFIEWKTKKGFHVYEAYTDEIGTTTTEIKNYIE